LNDAQDRIGVVCDQRALLESAREWPHQANKGRQRESLQKLLKVQERRYGLAHQRLVRWWSAKLIRRFRLLWKAAAI
jgi:hypothetical protein